MNLNTIEGNRVQRGAQSFEATGSGQQEGGLAGGRL
jgi:hypothetical protein